jgi:hypothetical protein
LTVVSGNWRTGIGRLKGDWLPIFSTARRRLAGLEPRRPR